MATHLLRALGVQTAMLTSLCSSLRSSRGLSRLSAGKRPVYPASSEQQLDGAAAMYRDLPPALLPRSLRLQLRHQDFACRDYDMSAEILLPSLSDSDVCLPSQTHTLPELHGKEGSGTIWGRPAVIKTVSMDAEPSAAEAALAEVRTYKQLAALQGMCVPVLEAAGCLRHESTVVAIGSGLQRLGTGNPALRPSDTSHQMRWEALESLRRIHDNGVLHGNVSPRSIFVQLAFQDGAGNYDAAEADNDGDKLLWADFSRARIVPGLSRQSPAAQDESFIAALWLRIPEWNHAHLLQLGRSSRECSNSSCGAFHSDGNPDSEQTLAYLLRAFPQDEVQLGQQIVNTNTGAVFRGTVSGQQAIIKLVDLVSPTEALEVAAEVMAYKQLASLQGHYVPQLLAAGTVNMGRSAFVALMDAGTSVQELELQYNPLQDEYVITPQECTYALEALSAIHDQGVLHGDTFSRNLMVQRSQCAGAAVPAR